MDKDMHFLDTAEFFLLTLLRRGKTTPGLFGCFGVRDRNSRGGCLSFVPSPVASALQGKPCFVGADPEQTLH